MEDVTSIKLGIIVASDRCSKGEAVDGAIPLMETLLARAGGFKVIKKVILPDEIDLLAAEMIDMADNYSCSLVLTTGGTGFSKRDVTPEATLRVIERRAPGIPEAMRHMSLSITDKAMLARQEAGIRGDTLIVNLPGSLKAIEETLPYVLPALVHGLEMLEGKGH
jgi:molybdenum cofactor synthesis domain-containing protein